MPFHPGLREASREFREDPHGKVNVCVPCGLSKRWEGYKCSGSVSTWLEATATKAKRCRIGNWTLLVCQVFDDRTVGSVIAMAVVHQMRQRGLHSLELLELGVEFLEVGLRQHLDL